MSVGCCSSYMGERKEGGIHTSPGGAPSIKAETAETLLEAIVSSQGRGCSKWDFDFMPPEAG